MLRSCPATRIDRIDRDVDQELARIALKVQDPYIKRGRYMSCSGGGEIALWGI